MEYSERLYCVQYIVLVRSFSASNSVFDEWSSFLSAVLYVNLPPTALLVVLLSFRPGAELMPYSLGLRHALCASGI